MHNELVDHIINLFINIFYKVQITIILDFADSSISLIFSREYRLIIKTICIHN